MNVLADVNTTDLRSAIALGCRAMQRVLAADNEIQFFAAEAWLTAWLGFSPAHWEGHVPGRHFAVLLESVAPCLMRMTARTRNFAY